MSFECLVCGGRSFAETLHAREMMFGSREPFDYGRCADCSSLNLIGAADIDLGAHYPDGYYSFASGGDSGLMAIARRMVDRSRFDAPWLGRALPSSGPTNELVMLRMLGVRRGHRVLDVGCGSGALLDRLRGAGFGQLAGADPFGSRDRTASGVPVHLCEVGEISGEFDVVMFHHSLEHVLDPVGDLVAARSLLSVGGRCIVRLPVVDSDAYDEYGVDWSNLDPPRHVFLPSRAGLATLASRAGFRIAQQHDDAGTFGWWCSELYRRDVPLRVDGTEQPASSFSSEELSALKHKADELNVRHRGDQVAALLVAP